MCFANKERLFSKMSRTKSRTQTEICGDCGASDPSWASINRGILLCAECCSVHRSLGRHISQVKSLRQGSWPPSVFSFVNSLNSHGANSVWEHCLMDSIAPKGLKRKPSPKDSLHPTKADFIRAKHVNLSFVLKPQLQQVEDGNLEVELSRQLRASVRSANLETSLRLMVQGADPNYYHEEKGSTPLHVAAKSGQMSQIELLIVYGANLSAKDSQGHTAIEIAKNNKHFAIAERLTEAMYEVTDRLCVFLGGRKPDHTIPNGKHFIIPESNHNEISEQLKIARGKLQLIPNKMFEELVMDIYDEVDRREMEAIWATSALNPEIGAVPFLPTNPHLSATRNQGRQKLARFSPIEFSRLVTDVLIDARRRQNMAALRPIDSPVNPNIANLKQQRDSNLSDDEPLYDAVASDDDYAALPTVAQQALVNKGPSINSTSHNEVDNLRRKLLESFSEIDKLKSKVEKLSVENNMLKSRIEPEDSFDFDVPLRIDLQTNGNDDEADGTDNEPVSDGRNAKRPVSMFEPREGPNNTKQQQQIPESRTTASMYQMAGKRTDPTLPVSEDVKRRTDLVTRRIQELWTAMQDMSIKDTFVPSSDRIRLAVAELSAIFPVIINDEIIKNALKQLKQNTSLIQSECARLQRALLSDDVTSADLYMQEVRNSAYNLAMATKMLVTQFP